MKLRRSRGNGIGSVPWISPVSPPNAFTHKYGFAGQGHPDLRGWQQLLVPQEARDVGNLRERRPSSCEGKHVPQSSQNRWTMRLFMFRTDLIKTCAIIARRGSETPNSVERISWWLISTQNQGFQMESDLIFPLPIP